MSQLTLPASPELGRFNVIDETNYQQYADAPSTRPSRGFEGRDYSRFPFGSMPWGAMPFRTIPRSEWKERIEDGHKKKTFPIYHMNRKKVRRLNQGQIPYCWQFSVVGAVQAAMACNSSLAAVHLSACSCGAPGKNYRKEGGWTGEGIGYAKKFGIATVNTWPEPAVDRQYFRGSREEAEKYNVGQWFELRPRNFDEVMTCLLYGFPVCVGLLWWGHAVFYSAPIVNGREFGVIETNSWGADWENDGNSVLMESKATPDEANVITTAQLTTDQEVEARYKDFFDLLTAS